MSLANTSLKPPIKQDNFSVAEPIMMRNEVARTAMGGTELMGLRLKESIPEDLLNKFQIWFSRYRPEEIVKSKYQIFYAHDLPGDPESDHLHDRGWNKFDHIVFVSNWQMQQYCAYYGIPYSACSVLQNAIEPIEVTDKTSDIIRIGYWSTPHRGLSILVPVFEYLADKYPNIQLDVFSSFGLYGWTERDAPFEALFERCKAHPKIQYHSAVANEVIRDYAAGAHILAYPSIWSETSCLVLMEAMSAKMLAVHSNLAALYETAANWTSMYQFAEDPSEHAARFHAALEQAILFYDAPLIQSRLESQKAYADVFYNWNMRAVEWQSLLTSLASIPRRKQGSVILSSN